MKKTALKKQGDFKFKRYLPWLLAIMLVVIGIFLIKLSADDTNDIQKFKQAELKIEEVYSQVEGIIGKPDKVARQENCDRPNMKSTKGPLGCDVFMLLLFQEKNATESNALLKKVSGITQNPLRIGSGAADKSLTFLPSNEVIGEQVFFQNLFYIDNISCGLGYHYPVNDGSYYDLLQPQYSENFVINISCGGPAKAEYYPMRD